VANYCEYFEMARRESWRNPMSCRGRKRRDTLRKLLGD